VIDHGAQRRESPVVIEEEPMVHSSANGERLDPVTFPDARAAVAKRTISGARERAS
jgi:hypothetical protein